MTTPISVYNSQKNSPDDRIILQGLAEGGATAAPSGSPVLNTQGADRLHIYSDLAVTVTGLAVQIWYYSSIVREWFEGPLVQLSALGTKRVVVDPHGEQHMFLQVAAASGTGTYKLWAAVSFEGRS